MGWPVCNQTEEHEKIEEDPVWLGLTFHRFGLIVSASFALIAVLVSWYLIWQHTTHYLKPWEQKHIIRVLFMVPIYAMVSFLSYLYYRHAVYFEVLRDCYEAFAIASFFALLCHYTAPDLHSQKDYFRSLRPTDWILPLSWFKKCCGGESGIWRTPRSGLTWFNIIWFGVFQYCFVRVFMTLVALVTQATGRYCLESLNPAFAHVWVMVIEGGCVTIAMYCLIQFYVELKNEISEHKPLLKILAIKLVIFLSFWQNLIISFLTSTGVITSSKRFDTPDIKVGIPSFLLCIEMAIFSIFHLWAFPWTVYDIKLSSIVASESVPGYAQDPRTDYKGGWLGSRALIDAFNPWDLVKSVGRGFKWFVVGRRIREQDSSYKNSAHANGLGSARTSLPLRTNASLDSNDFSTSHWGGTRITSGRKPSHYRSLEEDEEEGEDLLINAQSMPRVGPYSRPDLPYAPHKGVSAVDIGTINLSSGNPDHAGTQHLAPGRYFEDANNDGFQDSRTLNPALDDQDTGYHGASPVPISDAPQRHNSSHRQQESNHNVWGSGSRRERDEDNDVTAGMPLGSRRERNGSPF